jgi:peptidyl-prolyl cis-trans isomerase SurA
MKNLLFFIFFVNLVLSAQAQNNDPVIIEISGNKIYKSEFEAIFKKNNTDNEITKESLDDYLELFINYKLKVKAAEDAGLDTLKQLQSELRGYRKQLSRPYLSDNTLNESIVREAYDRLKKEVRASHILLRVDLDADPKDTLDAFNRINQIRESILKGADFNQTAAKKSEDPSAVNNGGDLGYFTALRLVYPFETAAYTTPIGEISQPIRTRFGYHLVKVTDIRDSRGEVQVAHILIQSSNDASQDQQQRAKDKADEIFQKIISGEEGFEIMAQKYSDDKQTGRMGGILPAFGPGRMVREFEEPSFELKVGEISKPVKTDYGWHIIKKIEHKHIGSFEEMKKEIEAKVAKDSRSKLIQDSFINKLKKEYKLSVNQKGLTGIQKLMTDDIKTGSWQPTVTKKHEKNTLISFANQKINEVEFINYLQLTQRKAKIDNPEEFFTTALDNFIKTKLIDYEESILEDKYMDFRILMNEYRDGVLLFEMTERKVWKKALEDSIGLNDFYERNKDEFMWPERIDGVIFTCKSKDIATKARKLLTGKDPEEYQEIINQLNEESNLNIRKESGKFDKKSHEVLSSIPWKTGFSDIIELNDQFLFVAVHEVLPVSHKTLDEAKGIVASKYQAELEENWIKDLRNNHTIKVNRDVLYSIK